MRDYDDVGQIEDLLGDAGARWRARQVFDAVDVPPRIVQRKAAAMHILSPALGLVAVVVALWAVVAVGQVRFPGAGSAASPSADPSAMTSGPIVLTEAEQEAARIKVVEAVNSDAANFGIPFLADDGVLVLQYFDEEARAVIAAQVPQGLEVRWEKVEYSQSELWRIASEIGDLNLDGVFAISTGTSRNRVVVKVGPSGSVDEVRQTLAAYGAAVLVEGSSDLPIALPGQPTEAP